MKRTPFKLILVLAFALGAITFWLSTSSQSEVAGVSTEPQASDPKVTAPHPPSPPASSTAPASQAFHHQPQTPPVEPPNLNAPVLPNRPAAIIPKQVVVASDLFKRLRALEVLKVQQTTLAGGSSTRVDTLVKTDGKHSSVVVRQQFSANAPSADSLASESAFVSDHVIVAPQQGETEAAFDARIQQAGFRTLKRLPNSDIRLVAVGAPSLTAVDQALQRLAGAEPDYLVFTQETLGSAKELIWVDEAKRFLDPETQDWWVENENSSSIQQVRTVEGVSTSYSPLAEEGGLRLLDFADGNGDYRPYVYRHGFKISRSVPETDPYYSVYIQEAYTTGYPQNGGSYLRTMSSDETAVFEHKDKLPFKAHSVDLAEYSTVFANPKTITVTGVRQNGSTVTTTFTTDGKIDGTGSQADFQTFNFPATFDSLVKLTFSNPPFMLDNMRVTLDGQETPPAVPPTLPLVYDVTWNESPHELGKTTAVGGSYAPTSINFGSPTVRSSLGALTDRPIELIGSDFGSGYSQPRFDLLLNAKRYRLEFEMTSLDSDEMRVFFDGPTGLVSFDFFGNGAVRAFGASMPASLTYVPSQLNRIVLEVNISAKTFSYQLNGQTPITGAITASLADVKDIRFSLTDAAPAGGTAIDNVRISAFGIGEQSSAPVATYFPSEGLTFPNTSVGSSITRFISIYNYGLSPLNLQFLSLSNPQFTLEGPIPAQLTAGQSFNISTRFTPTTTGTVTGDLKIATNDPNRPQLNIPLRGTVQTPPAVSLEPAYLRATVLADTRGTENFVIRNSGTSLLQWQIIRTQSGSAPSLPERQTNDPQLSSLWGLKSSALGGIDALTAWQVHTGSPSVTVAVIDTGVSLSHPDLTSNLKFNTGEVAGNQIDDDGNGFIDDVNGWSFYFDHSSPDDQHGHGTHVAGTIAATGNNNTGVVGVTWNCRILPIQFLGPNGSGYTSDAISSVNYAKQRGAQFINASWGGGGFSSLLQQSIQSFCQVNHGLFIAAAGNQGFNTDNSPHYPSGYAVDGIISVASTTQAGLLSSFSNFGKLTVDLAAPGSNILSTLPGSKYGSYSGTSMAAPHVAGVAALLKSANQSYAGQQIKTQILTSTDYPPALNQKVGSDGRLNAYQSLRKMPDSWLRPLVSYGTVAGNSEQTVELEVNSTGLAPGIHQSTLALTTNDPARPNIQLPVELKVVAPTTLASWRSTNFAQNQLLHLDSADSLWADDADPDGDGIDNLLEFAFNLSPHQRDSISKSLALTSTVQDPAHLLVTTRSNLGPVDVIPEWSSSLQPNSWSSSGLDIDALSTDATEGTTTWKITLDPALGSPSRAFFRVRADSNEN